ncbi:hypothetical protein VB002_10760 [Campylobacter concisus]
MLKSLNLIKEKFGKTRSCARSTCCQRRLGKIETKRSEGTRAVSKDRAKILARLILSNIRASLAPKRARKMRKTRA